MEAEGYFNITRRIKDMIIRGGENVYPREIEEFLYTHPNHVKRSPQVSRIDRSTKFQQFAS
jgi:acyl-CoA synthetase (AMP-forming)/AMP-acid ligase II